MNMMNGSGVKFNDSSAAITNAPNSSGVKGFTTTSTQSQVVNPPTQNTTPQNVVELTSPPSQTESKTPVSQPQMQKNMTGPMFMPTILVIEDNPLLSSVYRAKLSSEGFNVMMASNGTDGLRLATQDGIDVIILDIMMPGLSGTDILKIMRTAPHFKTTPVIIVTNLDSDDERKTAQKYGVLTYLTKTNVGPSEIVEKVQGIIKNANSEVKTP